MVTTRRVLEGIDGHLDESLGVREIDHRPRLSPVPASRDVGRRPLRNVGQVEVDLVIPDPDQPRAQFSEEALERLAQSIRDKGQLSPIRVRWSDDRARWVIVSGERRWRATQRAGLPVIDCHFHDGELSRSEILEQQLIENLLREDLQPIEEARAFAQLIAMNGWTGKQLADALRVPPSKVSRALALLKLPDDVQAKVADGAISARSAYEISRLPDDQARRALAEKAASGVVTHQDAANVVRQRKGKRKAPARGTKQTFLTEDGWKVVVSANRKGTYHELEQALLYALDEVRTRIRNNVYLGPGPGQSI
jgi:ParB family chromosome partitioning protein